MTIPPVQRLGSAVLLQGPAVIDTFYLVALGIKETRRTDGIAPSPRLQALAAALRDAAAEARASVSRHERVARPARQAPSGVLDEIYTEEAAVLLGLTRRHVQRIAADLGGRRRHRLWVFDRGAVECAVADRAQTRQRGAAR